MVFNRRTIFTEEFVGNINFDFIITVFLIFIYILVLQVVNIYITMQIRKRVIILFKDKMLKVIKYSFSFSTIL